MYSLNEIHINYHTLHGIIMHNVYRHIVVGFLRLFKFSEYYSLKHKRNVGRRNSEGSTILVYI